MFNEHHSSLFILVINLECYSYVCVVQRGIVVSYKQALFYVLILSQCQALRETGSRLLQAAVIGGVKLWILIHH